MIDNILAYIANKENYVLLDTSKTGNNDYLSYLFENPVTCVYCDTLSEIPAALKKIDSYIEKGFYAAGYVSYEAGYGEEDALPDVSSAIPFIWFGIYNDVSIYDIQKKTFLQCSDSLKNFLSCKKEPVSGEYRLSAIQPNISYETYENAVSQIKSYIAAGDTYQVNYTLKLNFNFSGSPISLYRDLRKKQPVPYSALIKHNSQIFLSLSPELFFSFDSSNITMRPMKGTIERGKTVIEDGANKELLQKSAKDRAENIMIVDLLRNDLGRIANTGSVTTTHLYDVERYKTLFQMTSTIKAAVSENSTLQTFIKHLFPSGSITGAPKIRTMQIIHDLEKEPRGIYTGTIGFFSPAKKAVFNVAIRTLSLDLAKKKGEMGVGSGITWSSDTKKEYHECILKSRFLSDPVQEFELIETMLWEPGSGYFLLDYHLDRLKKSAGYFEFPYPEKDIISQLNNIKTAFSAKKCKIRLLLAKTGVYTINHEEIPLERILSHRITFSNHSVRSDNVFLFHKTTNRNLYTKEYTKYKKDFADIIFCNERGEITEGAISNIFIKKDGTLFTPPVKSGLLNGVYRRYILETSSTPVYERILSKEDILTADEIFISNSVRKLTKVFT